MKFIRIKLLVALLGAGIMAAGVTSIALAASHHARARGCYGVCGTRTSLSLSRHRVLFGEEQVEVFRVRVRPVVMGGAGTPTGIVKVQEMGRTLCTIRLVHGTGSCALRRRELRPSRRPYRVDAVYLRHGIFGRSVSGDQFLEVLR